MTVRKGIFLPAKYRICVPTENTRRKNGAGHLYGENGNQQVEDTYGKQSQKAAAVGAQAEQFHLPHGTGTEGAGKRPYSPGML